MPEPRPTSAPPEVVKAVFPAAGLGTRFLPATKAVPKEMLPLVDRPVIEYAVDEVADAGIRHVIVVTGRGKSAIEDHFDAAPELEAKLESLGRKEALADVRRPASRTAFSYVRQAEARGLGHAVLTARPLVGDEPFVVVLCDDVVRADPGCTAQMLDVYRRTGASVLSVEPVEVERTSSYGIVAGDVVAGELWGGRLLRVRDLVEKPRPSDAPSNLAIIGRYVLTPAIFAKLAKTAPGAGGEIQLTDAIRLLLADEPVYAYRFAGRRHDAGSKLGFLQATVELALERADLEKPLRDHLRRLV